MTRKMWNRLVDNYFECKCPPDLKSGKDDTVHITPRDCSTTKEEIAKERRRRKDEGHSPEI